MRPFPECKPEIVVKREPSISLEAQEMDNPENEAADQQGLRMSVVNFSSREIFGLPSLCSVFVGEHVPFCYNL